MIDCKWYNYHRGRKKRHMLFEQRYWISKISERKTQPVLTSNYSTWVETGATWMRGKKSRGSSSRCRTASYEEVGTSRPNFYNTSTIYSTSCYDFIGSRWEDALESRNSTNHLGKRNWSLHRLSFDNFVRVAVLKNCIRYWVILTCMSVIVCCNQKSIQKHIYFIERTISNE